MARTDPGGLRVLSLDGPPVAAAALSELFFLQQIAHRWAYNEDDEDEIRGDDIRVSDMFDVISGGGIGGLYAILFARLNMTIGQVIQFHNLLIQELFLAKCWAQNDHQECTKAFDNVLDQMVSHSGMTVDLNSPLFSKDCKKCCIVVLNEVVPSSQSVRSLRSYSVRTGPSPRCTIRQALHATLADLEHLPAVAIEDELFIGTSNHFSNIARILLKEIAVAFPKLHLTCFVNIEADYTRPANNSHMIGQDLMSQFRDLECFFRLSVREELRKESRIKTMVIGYLQEDYVSNLVDRIVAAVRSCKQVVNLLRLGNLAGEDGRNELRRDVSHIRNEEETKRALEKIRASYNFRPIHERGCLAGTREDVLKPIESWADDIDAPNVFWLEGYPGTGKTAISITLKQRLAEARRLGASCFFRREDASQHSLSTLFRSIASQLAENHSCIRDRICHAVNSEEVILESAPSTLFEKLLRDPLVAASVSFGGPLVLVLDAMDEYGRSDESRMHLVKLLLPKWIRLPRQYKLFITSRSQGDLPLHLDLPGHMVRRLEVGAATSIETRSDIRRFLEHNFEEIRMSRGNSPAFVTSSELDELVVASAGLFIWASTVVELVKLIRTNVHQILRDLRDKGTTIGETKMDALYHLYSTVLQPLLKDNGSTVSFLSAVLCVKVPLAASALSPLCKLNVYAIEDTARQLGPVMDTTHGLRFVHKSFVDYVVSQYSPVQLSLDSSELMFATSCIDIMHDQLHFNMGKMPSSYMLNSEVPNLHEALSEELRYASRFWGTHIKHLRKNCRDKMMALAPQIDDLLNHQFLYWLEAVSILGCFQEAIEALSNLRVPELGKAACDLAQDALAFILQFAPPITQSYPHIYISSLPWTPTMSLIRARYLDTVPHALRIVSGGDETWSAQLAVIRGHKNSVQSVAFSPNGSQIVSGSDDKTVCIWNAATRQLIGEPLRGHDGWVRSVAFSPDGSQILSGSSDHTVRIWDTATRQPVGEPLRGHNDWVRSVAFSPDGSQLISGSDDKTVRIWDAATRQSVGEPLRGHNDWVRSVAFSPDGSQIVSGFGDNTVRIWDAVTRQPVGKPLRGHSGSVLSVAFSPDGSQIVSGSDDNTIRVWDAATRELVGERLQGHDGWVRSVAFSHDGSQIVSGSSDNTVRIWDAATRQQVGDPLRGHNGSVLSVAFSPNGSQIVSGSADKTVRIWDAATRQPVGEPLQGHNDWVRSVAFSPDGSQITGRSSHWTVRIWDAAIREPVREHLQSHDDWLRSVTFSPDGSQIVSGSEGNTVRIWDAATRQQVGDPLRGHNGSVLSVAFSHDGSQIVSGSDDNTVRIWDAATRQPVGGPLRGHNGSVHSVAFSHDGFQIVSGSSDNTVRMWDATTCLLDGEPLLGHDGWVRSVAFSHDGSKIVSGSYDNTVRIWDAATHQPVGDPLRGHNDWVLSVAFSPDGSQIVSGSADKTVRIWDAATCQPVGEPLRGHNDWVRSVAFSPDGSQIISRSSHWTVCIWDAATRQPVREHLRGYDDWLRSVAFSPDGSQIVSGSDDNTVRIWDAATRQLDGEPLRGHYGSVLSVAFSHDGSKIVSGSEDSTVRIWDAVTRQPVGDPLRNHNDSVHSVAFSYDGSQIVSGSSDNTVRIWDATTCKPVGEPLRAHDGSVHSVAFSHDGSQIVSGSEDNTVRIWDAVTRQPVGDPLRGHNDWVLSVAFSPNGSQIVSGSADKTVRIWDAATCQPVGEPLRGHNDWVRSVAFFPDGSQIISRSSHWTICIWDAATHQPIGEPLRAHDDWLHSVAFSPDGSQIVGGSDDNTVCIWDPVTRQPVGERLRGHNGSVRSVAFSPNGSQIISGSDDNTVRIWDSATRQPVGGPLRGHNGSVHSVAFSHDGSQIVSGSYDNTVRVWDATTHHPVGEPARILKILSFPRVSHPDPLHCFLLNDGWVIDKYNCRLVWTPQHLREYLPTPGFVDIVSTRRMVVTDVSNMQTGMKWSSCAGIS